MANFRVFVTRHYIDCVYYDVEADTKKKAMTVAKNAAKKLLPDVRAVAVDNHWQTDNSEVVELEHIGSCGDYGARVKEVYKNKNGIAYSHLPGN